MIVYGQKWVICTYSEKDKIKGQQAVPATPLNVSLMRFNAIKHRTQQTIWHTLPERIVPS